MGDVFMKSLLIKIVLILASGGFIALPTVFAQPALVIKPLSEKKTANLPVGPLFWRIENFSALDQAQSAAGPFSLVAESTGKVWLFTLGPSGGSPAGGTKVTELGPIRRVTAPEYLLRITEASGPGGSVTPVHTHPVSEAFFVLAGEQSIRSPDGALRVNAGQAEAGQGSDSPMQVSSTGGTDLKALVMFVVDDTQPFSSTAKFP